MKKRSTQPLKFDYRYLISKEKIKLSVFILQIIFTFIGITKYSRQGSFLLRICQNSQ